MNDLEKDAARWRWLREHQARSFSLHMDGTACFSLGHLPRARTLDEAMDAQMAKFQPHSKGGGNG